MTVFIDVDNTVLDFDKCAEESITRSCEKFGIPKAKEICEKFHPFNAILWQKIEKGELTIEKLLEIRFNTLFEAVGVTADGIAFEKSFHEGLASSAIAVDGAKDLLEYLSRKYDVYVASNAPLGQQKKRLEKAGFDKYVKGYFVSAQIGHLKPAKEFFDACFATIDDNPHDVYMIGDSLTADINGARNYGMKTVWFDKYKTMKNADCDFVVTSLSQIKTIL